MVAWRVLVVYSRVGGGHQSAARALVAALEGVGGDAVEATASDLYLEWSRFPVTRFPRLYAHLARHHPHLWSAVFYGTNRPGLPSDVVLGPFIQPGLQRLLAAERPDVVVSTVPGVNGLIARAAAQASPSAATEVVVTDWYQLHRTWAARNVDHYTVPSQPAADDLVRYGVAPERTEVIGLPLRPEFATGLLSAAERAAVRSSLELDPKGFTVLVMVGAEGSPRALSNVRALQQLDEDLQLIVVCGRNERLRRRVERVPSRPTRRVLGFVDRVADLMRAADLLVTKAGGLTLAEAFCCGVPTIVNDVLPGQEAGNTAYALQHGAVAYAESPRQLVDLVKLLRTTPKQRATLATRAAALARPDAGPQIARGMLARLGERSRSTSTARWSEPG